MRRMSRAAGALKTALGRRGSIRSKILAGFTVILVGMLSINLLVIGLSHHFLGEYHILAERVISANKLIPTVRDDVSLDAYYLVAGRRTLETTQLFHHMEEIRQGLYLLKQENNSENGRIQLQIATRTFGTLQRYCQKLGQEIDADVSLELQNVTLEQIRDVSALVYNQIEEYIYLELLWGESIDQMLQTGFQLLLLGDLAAVVLMVAVLAFLLMRINRTINDPIQALVENTRRLAEGDFDALMEDAGENEVTILNKSFNRMAAKLQRLMEKVEEDTRTQEQLELRLLQEQINPHFLYNTLEGIRSEALIAGLDSIAEMTEALATFFRYTISNLENLVTLEDELANIENYYYIQQFRFGSKLDLKIQYDRDPDDDFTEMDFLQCKLPKLTLQPIVENSIYHGIERKIGKGHLVIRISASEEWLYIRISDDGRGMTDEKLKELNEKLRRLDVETDVPEKEEEKKPARGGIAVVNVNRRIKLLFGEEYGIHVYSKEGIGTDVIVELPLVRDGDRQGGWR